MYLLKKLVGIGNEKTTKEIEAEGESLSESHNGDTGTNYAERKEDDADVGDEKLIEEKKKGHKSKKKKKSKKTVDDETTSKRFELAVEKNAVDEKKNSDNETPKHHIPDKFFDDLSETDKSHEGGSTSQDVSSSDISESCAIKASEEVLDSGGNVDIWADRDEDDFIPRNKLSIDESSPKEVVDFDEFWAEFDEEEGKLRRPSQVDVESTSDTDGKNMVTARDETFHSYETEDLSKDGSNEKALTGYDKDSTPLTNQSGSEGVEDFWGDESVGKNVREGKTGNESLNEEEESERVDDFWGDEPMSKKLENDEKAVNVSIQDEESKHPDDFWGDEPMSKKLESDEKAINVSIHEEESKRVDDFWGDKSVSEEVQYDGKDDKKSGGVEDFWGDESAGGEGIEDGEDSLRDRDKDSNELDESLKNESNVDECLKNDSNKSEADDFLGEADDSLENKGSKENIGDVEDKSSRIDDEETAEDFWGNANEASSLSEKDKSPGKLTDSENEVLSKAVDIATEEAGRREINENNEESKSKECDEVNEAKNTPEESSLSEVKEVTDDFWDSKDDDPLPPVFTLRKSIDDNSLTEKNETNSTQEEAEENDTKETDAEEKSERTSSEEAEPSDTPTGPTSEATSKEEVESKTIDELDEVKTVHRKSFASALRDIEAPTRRRSLLPLDNRERIIREERSSRPSESSGEGEVSEDDGIMDYLGKENKSAEARLAARRQARVEAREIRMRELERVQKEQQEEGSDRVFDLHATPRSSAVSPRERPTPTNSYHSSRRSSEDSMEDGLGLRDIRHELKEVEEKFRKAMIANAQLDNEKAALSYQVELLKDKLEDLEEAHSQLGREHREKCREHEALKRAVIKLKEDLNMCKYCLEERDNLIANYGLVIVGGEIDENGELTPRSLVSNQSAELLQSAGEGSLDVRLKTLANEKNELLDEVRHLKLELEEEKNRKRNDRTISNGPIGDELQQTLNDYRFRLQKAEQETNTLQATVARLESQVIRYKSAAEASEKAEDELKLEKRKLQREHRESISRIEELETANSHLQRRMDKLKNAKSTLLKEL